MKKFLLPILTATLFLTSCGSSIDKNSFEGRVASVISAHDGVNMALSMDMKSIIDKSGIKDGAIPEQYLATIQPFMDALTESINLDKQVFMVPIIDATNPSNNGFIFLFDVKDADRLKKEFKEMGLNIKSKGDLEYDARENEAAGIFKGQTGFVVMMSGYSVKLDDAFMTSLGKSLGAGKTVDGVVDFVNLKADMTLFSTGDKPQIQQKTGVKELDEWMNTIAELSKGTYAIGQMSFNNQDAVMSFDMTYGKNMKKHMPMMRDKISQEAQSVVISDETIMAFAFNMNFEKLMDFLIDRLDQKTKDELNKNLGMVGGLEKFKKLITGEMAFSISTGEEEPKVNFFLGVGDKKQVQSLLNSFGFFLNLKKSGDGYQMENGYLTINDKGAFLGMSKADVEKMKSNKNGKIRAMGDFKFGATSYCAFVDFKMLSKIEAIEEMAGAWKDLDYATMEMTEKGMKMVVKSTKSNQNILRTMIEAVMESIRLNEIEEEKRRKEYEEMWGDESEWASTDWDDTY